MRRILHLTAAAVFGVVALTPVTGSAHATRPTVAEQLFAVSNQNGQFGFDDRWWDFDIFINSMIWWDFGSEVFFEYDGPLTVFAPTDRAFRRLARESGAPRGLTESETVNWLYEHIGPGPLQDAVLDHVYLGRASYRRLLCMDGESLRTEGVGVEIDVVRHRWVRLVDGDPDDRDAVIIRPNIGGRLADGYLHGINRMIRPFDLRYR